jgi:aldehyde:ferredoxin oxidoreductase
MNLLEYFAGRGLTVDLVSGKVRPEILRPEEAERRVGGAALNLALFQRYAQSDPIILSAGPLTASFAPGSCLAVMTARSAVNGNIYHVPLTWQAGAELRFSGLDYLVILGRAAKPAMLRIRRGQGELSPAENLWGKDIPETVRAIRAAYPADSRCILAIGPAGEGGTLYAQVDQNFWGTLDKAGFGALWGRKKLKVLLLTGMGGSLKVHPDHPALSRAFSEEIKKTIPSKVKGSLAVFRKLGEKSFDRGLVPPGAKPFACFHCPFPCQSYIQKKSLGLFSKKQKRMQATLLLTDPGGSLAFRHQGENALSWLAECFRLGLEPMAAALFVGSTNGKAKESKPEVLLNLIHQEENLAARGLPNIQNLASWLWPENGITAMAEKLGFSMGIPPIAPEGPPAGQSLRDWVRRVASSLILGVCPILLLIAPVLNEEKLIAFMGSGDKEIAANMDRLHAAARDLLGEMANPPS